MEFTQYRDALVENVFDFTPELLAVYDTDLNIIKMNKAALKVWKKTAEDAEGRHMLTVFPELEHSDYHKDLLRAVSGETIHNQSYRSNVSGNYYENFVVPLRNDTGDVYAVLAIAHDNTKLIRASEELKKKNEELESAQSFLQQLIDSSVEYISVLDRDLNIITVNSEYEKGTGLEKERVKGENIFDITPVARDSEQHRAMEKALAGEKTYIAKHPALNRPELFVDTHFIPLNIRGAIEGVIIMSRDVSAIVHSEILLEKKNLELERSNKELESFNYIASHDMQEPLRKIRSFISLLENTEDADKQKLYGDKIRRSAERMSILIENVLTYSRISEGRNEFEQVSLEDILENVQPDFELVITEKHASIISDPLPVIEAVPLQMQQLFSNLISNALKYCSAAPVLKINCRVRDENESLLLYGDSNKRIELTFSDNGIGFEPQYKEKIFNLFQRLHGRSQYEGTGIGLSIVKKIIEKHHGHIEVTSEEGKGTAFTIYLPVKQPV